MSFTSLFFVTIFLPIVLFVLWGVDFCRRKSGMWENLILSLFSLIFVAWAGATALLFLCGCIIFTGVVARLIARGVAPRFWLTIGIVANLSMLVYCKYFSSFLPFAMSFYVFQGIGYLIDVKRGGIKPPKNYIDFPTFMILFPQLAMGPILRYRDVADNLCERKITIDAIDEGIIRFSIGLFKKVVIAGNVAEFVDETWKQIAMGNVIPQDIAWIATIAYSIQIYFDFSGYSDMAIGIGKMLGFNLPENFRYPYVAISVRDFWRRWHITLSSWFRDYLYIPLGGGRVATWRIYLNNLLVFVVCGIWHGNKWTFLCWGLWHGLFIICERLIWGNRAIEKAKWLHVLGTFFAINLGWVLFRADSFTDAWTMLKSLTGIVAPAVETKVLTIFMAPKFLCALLFGSIFSLPIIPFLQSSFAKN